MADETGKAWAALAKRLAADLPGEWVVGRPGAKAILVRRPIEWTLCWVGLDRPRRTDQPFLLAGVVDLIRPFSLGYQHGLRSGDVERPGTFAPVAEDADRTVTRFVEQHALPVFERWTPDALAEEAEQTFARPAAERGRPVLFPSAAGWRVVRDTGSPVDPATQAVAEYEEMLVPDHAAWYRDLLTAWESGGRAPALEYLEQQRAAVLAGLKLA